MAVTIVRRFFRALFLFSFTLLFSCEEQGMFIVCSDCFDNEPVVAKLRMKIEQGSPAPVVIRIYEGNLEDNVLIYSTQTFSDTFYHEVNLNRKYTITATYQFSDDTYIAVDSATPKVKYSKDQCDNPCYWVYDRILDLSLKSVR